MSVLERLELNRASPFARGLVGFWPMGHHAGYGTSRLVDLSDYADNGTLTNTPTWGYDGQRVHLNFAGGSSEYVDVGFLSQYQMGSGNYTLAAWVNNSEVNPNNQAIAGNGATAAGGKRYRLIWESGAVSAELDDNATKITATTGQLDDGQWHWVVATRGPSNLRVWADGDLKASTSSTGVGNVNDVSPHGFKINATTRKSDSAVVNHGTQLIDGVMLWNRRLAQAEIEHLYDEMQAGQTSATARYGSLIKQRRVTRVAPEAVAATTWHGMHAIDCGDVYGGSGVQQGLHSIGNGIHA